MATPFEYRLVALDAYDAGNLVEGSWFPTWGRDRWDFALDVARLASGGSVTVIVEAAPVADEDYATTIGTFNSGAISSTGTHTLTSYGNSPDITWASRYRWIRAKASAQTGDDAIFEVIGTAPFLDPATDDENLLSKELREFQDGRTRLVETAERDIRDLLLYRDRDKGAAGMLDIRSDAAGVYEEVQYMVAEQAEHLFHRHRLAQRANGGDQTAGVTLRGLPDVVHDVADRIGKLRRVEATVWRGR